MRFGAHLPIAGFGGERPSAFTLVGCAEAAEALGYTTLCANDHILFSVPWTDGLVALGAAAARTRSITLMTTAALLVVRGAASLGSALVALHHLSGGRLRVGLTPGSTQADYERGSCGGDTAVDSELGIRGRLAASRPARRRLARLCVSLHPRALQP